MVNVFVHVLQAIVSHATDEEPRPNVLVLLKSERLLSLRSAVNIDTCEVARELSLVLCDKAPLREFVSLGPLYE